jgi:hypothetical protein
LREVDIAMGLSKQQITNLIGLIASTHEDDLDCDGCLNRVAEYADHELAGLPASEAADKVRRHLESCPCCADEYQALLDALAGIDES